MNSDFMDKVIAWVCCILLATYFILMLCGVEW